MNAILCFTPTGGDNATQSNNIQFTKTVFERFDRRLPFSPQYSPQIEATAHDEADPRKYCQRNCQTARKMRGHIAVAASFFLAGKAGSAREIKQQVRARRNPISNGAARQASP